MYSINIVVEQIYVIFFSNTNCQHVAMSKPGVHCHWERRAFSHHLRAVNTTTMRRVLVVALLLVMTLHIALTFADQMQHVERAHQRHTHDRHMRRLHEYHADGDKHSSSSSTTHERPYDYYQYYDPGTPSPTRTPRPHPPSSNTSAEDDGDSTSSYHAYEGSSSSSDDGDDDHTGLWLSIGMVGVALVAFGGFIALFVLSAANRL